MAALSAGSLTYTINNRRRLANSKVHNKVNIVLAAGQTYPTGGIAIGTTGTIANTGAVGCPNTIESLVIADAGTSGYVFNYNLSTGKLQMFNGYVTAVTTGTPNAEVANSVTPGALSIYCEVIGW